MDNQYRYWKSKRHVSHFVILMVCITTLIVSFFFDVIDYMRHADANGVVDPDYESPTTIIVVIAFLVTVFVLILFIVDLVYYFNVKSRLKRSSANNIEISIKTDDEKVNAALNETNAKFLKAGLVADINKQTEIDAEYAYKLELKVDTKETFPLFLYILYKPLTIGLIAIIVICAGLNLLININNPKDAIIPTIICCSASILFLVFIFLFLVFRANASKKKAILNTKEMGFRIYAEHIEQYNIIEKDGSEAEIRYKVPFFKMKHLETKRAIYCRGLNNGQVVALRLDKSQMPEEALILFKSKLNK